METSYIDSFVAIAECGSMAEASRRLNLTPTALAQRIHVLERDFSTRLIVRSGRTVRLTESGARLLARARQFQQEVRELHAATLGEGMVGGLRLGAISTAATGLLPPMLSALVERHPGVDAYIEVGVSRDLYHQVLHDKLDAAVMVAPPFAIPKSLTWRTLREEPLIVLAPRSLAGRDPLQLLAEMPLIRYDRRNWGGSPADQFLQQHGIQPKQRFELDALDGIVALVGCGLGVSLVPDWSRAAPLPPGVVGIAVGGESPKRRIGMLWPTQSPYGRAFEDLLAATGNGGDRRSA
ncbi:DNA-binding transcriptional regulator, LysR family [Noviherbaspirillum humi]|uniref:DNA-binding transcriptional regulator, LysR family n=1 Tax=Noviherbaspirillum humi TaxID=1688639 RepID=A0A239JT04_9BURK|nr:LysR family transcriptional regulator [Noviherbaspirillum humi]SNT08682.1 DNA-binding transcriptional regulator, LysR family [Noviherbaspirillum humi]